MLGPVSDSGVLVAEDELVVELEEELCELVPSPQGFGCAVSFVSVTLDVVFVRLLRLVLVCDCVVVVFARLVLFGRHVASETPPSRAALPPDPDGSSPANLLDLLEGPLSSESAINCRKYAVLDKKLE